MTWKAVASWAWGATGSTRAVSLMRIALVATVWTRWADDLVLFRHVADGRMAFAAIFYVVTACAFFGFLSRVSMTATAACTLYLVYYLGHIKGVEAYTHHHATLLAWSCVWLACTPCGGSYSIDRWLAIRRAERAGKPYPEEHGYLWGARLLALQTSSIYFWTAINKCNLGFLSGSRLAHYGMYYYTGSSPLDSPVHAVILHGVAWSTVLLEFALAFGLFFAKPRRYLVVAGLLLHGVFYTLLSVYTFTVTMWILYLACFDAEEVHSAIDRLQGIPSRRVPASAN